GADVEEKHVAKIAAAFGGTRRAIDAVTRPRRRLNREQVHAIILGDRNAFAGEPIEIGIDAIARFSFARLGLACFRLRRLTDVHAFAPPWTQTIIRLYPSAERGGMGRGAACDGSI